MDIAEIETAIQSKAHEIADLEKNIKDHRDSAMFSKAERYQPFDRDNLRNSVTVAREYAVETHHVSWGKAVVYNDNSRDYGAVAELSSTLREFMGLSAVNKLELEIQDGKEALVRLKIEYQRLLDEETTLHYQDIELGVLI